MLQKRVNTYFPLPLSFLNVALVRCYPNFVLLTKIMLFDVCHCVLGITCCVTIWQRKLMLIQHKSGIIYYCGLLNIFSECNIITIYYIPIEYIKQSTKCVNVVNNLWFYFFNVIHAPVSASASSSLALTSGISWWHRHTLGRVITWRFTATPGK